MLYVRNEKRDNNQPFFGFDEVPTMVKTRQNRLISAEKRDQRRQQRELISPSVRAERLAITKKIASEIVRKQEDLRGSRYGCRVGVIRHYTQIYNWLNPVQVDWHVKQIKKRNASNASLAKDSNSTNSNVNINLVVNELEPNDKTSDSTNTVSPTFLNLFEVDCWGGRAHPFWMYPDPDGLSIWASQLVTTNY